MNNIIEILFERNRNVPNKIAFRSENSTITYCDFETYSRRIANWMIRYGIKSGDRVSIVLYDNIDTIAVICATVLIGAVACMINPRGRRHNILYQSEHVEPKLVITETSIDIPNSIDIRTIVDSISSIEPWYGESSTKLDDVAFMLWTSGTTGNGKAVMQNHRNYIETSQKVGVETIGVTSQDKIYTTAKLFFAIGMYASFFWPMYASAESYLDSGLSTPARVRENIEQYQPTIFYSVPIVYSQLATREINCKALCLAGGDRLPQSVIDRWLKYSGQLIHNTSGVTEGTCCYTYNKLGTTSAGTIIQGYSMRIVDDNENELDTNVVGRLQIHTKFKALGYFKESEWTDKVFGPEWLSTGDYAYITESGQLNYMGRINDVIKINGQFINPGEIEETLLNYSGVEQAAVISRLGPDDLERVEAYIVPADNSKLDVREIRRWLLNYHEKHTCPRIIHLVDKLPRTDTGKVQRYLLKQN